MNGDSILMQLYAAFVLNAELFLLRNPDFWTDMSYYTTVRCGAGYSYVESRGQGPIFVKIQYNQEDRTGRFFVWQ